MFERHRSTLGALHLVLGLMNVVAALIVWFVLGGVVAIAQEPEATRVLGTIAALVGGLLFLLAIPPLVAGFGLVSRTPWSRTAAMVSSFLNMLSIPFGTGVSLFTLWVLFTEEASIPSA